MIIGQNSNSKTHDGKIVRTEFLSKLSERLVIVPAAGLGTRVGSPPAKELMPHPNYPMNFLEKALLRIKEAEATALIISRFDKTVLNDWLMEREIPHLLVKPTTEWVETVQISSPFWQKKNLLLLPDADFSPAHILADMFDSLDQFEITLATFKVEDLSLWGGVMDDEQFCISEKLDNKIAGLAWGLIGWRGSNQEFWPSYEKARISKKWQRIFSTHQTFKLDYYEDLTRG
ncbi:MAG: hypothetical protein AB7I27_06460 [Bacteriovoracaceae bacterium]